jgi:hypothetical protein
LIKGVQALLSTSSGVLLQLTRVLTVLNIQLDVYSLNSAKLITVNSSVQ